MLPVLTLPANGTAFDYFIDSRNGICVRWNERPLEKSYSFAVSDSYVVIPEVFISLCCYYIQQFCLQCFDAVGWAAGRASDP